ncbi:Uncharacterised protein [Providencia rustigianii]|nr:hypothetical protein [Providencia rustigianii]VEH56081.1 Uncharacterised protein [Providencia rustigianii]
MRKNVIALSIMSVIFSNAINANELKSIKIGGYVIPPAFVVALEEGMSIPVFLRLENESQQSQSENKIADAIIIIEQGKIKLANIHLVDGNKGPQLNKVLIEKIEQQQDTFFNENNGIVIDNNATLKLNISSFNLSLDVDKQAFSPKKRMR